MLIKLIKRFKSMARIYILPGPVKPLEILHRPSEKFSDILKKEYLAKRRHHGYSKYMGREG